MISSAKMKREKRMKDIPSLSANVQYMELPPTNPGAVRTTNGKDQAESIFQLDSINVTNEEKFPLHLDIVSEIHNIFAAGIFKNIENPALYDKICDMMFNERYIKLVESLFWTIFVVKFQKDDIELIEKLRKQLGVLYSEYFSLLQQPKEELSNIGILGAAYLCHIIFFNVFPKDRKVFDMRFILDCYHIVIHEVNGLFVTDLYIQTSIERLFGNKFFHFEKRILKKKKPEKKDFKDEPLLRNLNFDLKDFPNATGGLEFAHELTNKLRKAPKKPKSNLTELQEPKNNNHSNQPILKLTQPYEEPSFTSPREASQTYFPKLKFNCHQVSPTLSNFLENSNQTLPFKKKKVIHMSNGKNVGDSVPLNYQPPPIEPDVDTKLDKKDKKKHQLKGSITDYGLGNRNENYYLGYMPKDIKKKCKFALDMKFILDNVRPTIRGAVSLRPLEEDSYKKSPAYAHRILTSKGPIKEEEEDKNRNQMERISLEREDTVVTVPEASISKESFRKEKKEEETQENEISPKQTRTHEEAGANEFGLPAIKVRTKMHENSASFGKGSKKVTLAPKLEDEADVSKNPYESDKSLTSPNLKFYSAANKKLGKGRFFVSLADNEDDQDSKYQNKTSDKDGYADKRKFYSEEHETVIRRDVDANIESLIYQLKAKQSSFRNKYSIEAAIKNRK